MWLRYQAHLDVQHDKYRKSGLYWITRTVKNPCLHSNGGDSNSSELPTDNIYTPVQMQHNSASSFILFLLLLHFLFSTISWLGTSIKKMADRKPIQTEKRILDCNVVFPTSLIHLCWCLNHYIYHVLHQGCRTSRLERLRSELKLESFEEKKKASLRCSIGIGSSERILQGKKKGSTF